MRRGRSRIGRKTVPAPDRRARRRALVRLRANRGSHRRRSKPSTRSTTCSATRRSGRASGHNVSIRSWIATGREVCWVKYGDPAKFECWRWDDRFIYHEVDHALDGDSTGRSYSFSDGRWLPRHLSGTWTLNLPRNRAIDFTAGCSAAERRFPYHLRAYLEPARDLGGDLGDTPDARARIPTLRARRAAEPRCARTVLLRRGRGLVRVGERTRNGQVRPRRRPHRCAPVDAGRILIRERRGHCGRTGFGSGTNHRGRAEAVELAMRGVPNRTARMLLVLPSLRWRDDVHRAVASAC